LTVQASIKSDSGTEERISLSEAQPGVFSGVYLAQSDAKRVLHLTGTSNEPSGKTITIFDFNAATWSVKPVTFTIDALPSQLCQSSPNNVGVRFVDDERNPITEIPDSRYALSAALTFRSSGVTETVPLARMDNGIYRGQWTPASAGLYSADLSASSVDAQGSHFTNFDVADAIRAASVKASTALSAASTTGKLEEQQPIYFWFPIYSPLQLDFELRNEKAQLFDAAAAGISPTDLVGVKVTDPNGKAVDPKDIKLRPANQKGELHLEGNGLDTRGKWLIDITPNTLSLGEGCSVAASTSHFVVERDDNWLPYVVDGLVVLALGALFAQRTARFIGDHHGYMLSGSIYIQDGIGTNLPNGTKALRSLKVNRVVYTSRDLPAAAGIKKLTVKRVQLPKREAVDIEAEMSRGGSQIFKDRSYGSRCDLGNKYYIKYMQY
ncbi:MAG: hypothetical protein M1570_04305, partial [Chloroflexi bacterium]|nr:hypothetical protein [Chloroflexota bacterium]